MRKHGSHLKIFLTRSNKQRNNFVNLLFSFFDYLLLSSLKKIDINLNFLIFNYKKNPKWLQGKVSTTTTITKCDNHLIDENYIVI